MKTFLAALALTFSGTAYAQPAEFWFTAGANILKNAGLGTESIGGSANDITLTDGFRFGFTFCLNPSKYFGYEFGYNYNRTSLDVLGTKTGMAFHQVPFNFLVYARPEGERIRPYATAGAGFQNYVPPGSSAAQGGGQNEWGFNFGGGVKVHVKGMWAARFDVRDFTNPKPFGLPLSSGWLQQIAVTGGVGAEF